MNQTIRAGGEHKGRTLEQLKQQVADLEVQLETNRLRLAKLEDMFHAQVDRAEKAESGIVLQAETIRMLEVELGQERVKSAHEHALHLDAMESRDKIYRQLSMEIERLEIENLQLRERLAELHELGIEK